MPALTAHLCIDYGTATTTALLSTPDGRRLPVVIDGTTTIPSGVWFDSSANTLLTGAAAVSAARVRPDAWIATPLRHLGGDPIPVADTALDPTDAVAAVLRTVAAHASALAGVPIGGLTLIVPCWWGPHRRHQLRLAAGKAGLPEPRLIADAVAIATHWAVWSATPVATGTCVLVINAGASGLTLAVAQHNDDGVHLLAHHTIPRSDAAHIDAMLIDLAVSHAGERLKEWLAAPERAVERHHLLDAVRTAKESLGQHAARAAIVLPDPYPPVVLDQDALSVATAELRKQLPEAAARVLEAADTRREDLVAQLLTGGHANLPGLADTARETTGLPLIPISRPDVTVDGAMHIAAPKIVDAPASVAPDAPAPQVRYRMRSLAAPLLLAFTALVLLTHTLTTAWTRDNGGVPYAAFVELPRLGISGLLIALAGWSNGTTIAYLLHAAATTPAELAASTRITRRALLAAAAVTLALAAAFGVAASAHFNLYQDTFPRWPVLFALPVVVLTATAGLLITRIPPTEIPTWVRDARTPITATLVAALGVAILGIGIALAIVNSRTARLVTASGLAIAFGVLYTFRTRDYYIWAFTTIFMWWAVTAFVHTVRAASPPIDARIRQMFG
ncbi:Hsp70 family protein [Catenuloplanes sp. NPDC051500]|uniref:Hsp70 family protein n=1 Tax=Catenuloplanes sp. NPDC051500 TaxID=3363959 RepID=UPI00379A5451